MRTFKLIFIVIMIIVADQIALGLFYSVYLGVLSALLAKDLIG